MYEESPFLFAFNVFVDVFFFFDIGLNFRTAYYEHNMLTPVLEHTLIARHYVFGKSGYGGWFWVDLLAAIPFDRIVPDSAKGSALLAFFKVGRLFHLSRLMHKFDQLAAAHVVRVSNFLMLLLICTHSMACIWWSVGWITEDNRGWQFSPKVATVLLEEDLSESFDPLLQYTLPHGDVAYNGTRLREMIGDVVRSTPSYFDGPF